MSPRIWRGGNPPAMFAAIVFAVMDKEWPLSFVLAGFLGVGVIGFLVCRKWPLAAALFFPLLSYGGLRQGLELADPYVGPAMRAEAGVSYVILSWIVFTASFVMLAVGTVQGWKRLKLKAISR